MKAAAYLKSYTWGEAPGMRREQQLERIERHIADQGWELAGVLDDSVPEVGPREYPALDGLLADPGDVRKIVVASVDRIGRLPRRILSITRHMRDRGIDLVCIDQGVDTGADARTFEPTVAALAHWQPAQVRSAGWDPDRIRAHGFAPAAVIDVGAGDGTPQLFEAFDQAYLVLVEPLEEHRHELEHVTRTRPAEYHQTAIGSREGTITLEVDRHLELSTAVAIIDGREVVDTRDVPLTTLDRLSSERDWAEPLGLKIDVEGYEEHVIQGAVETLSRCEFVIVEASVLPRFDGDPTCFGLISSLRSHGFEVCDVIDSGGITSRQWVDLILRRRDDRGPG
jgi:FkbM family methyltransferase